MQQNTQEWLDFRRNKIGASDASVILGLSPYKTKYQLFEEKIFGKEQEQNGAMMRGHFMEEAARTEFEKQTGISVLPKIVVSSERPWQMASLDGISFDGKVFVEIKCPNREVHEMAEKGGIPDHYMAQMQHQMSVLNLPEGLYFSFDGRKGNLVTVKRQEFYIEEMIEEEAKFYECMKTQVPPALSDKDYVLRDDPQWLELAQEWKELSAYIKSMEENEEELRKKLLAFANGQSTKGGGIRVTRSIAKGQVNYKAIPELTGIDLEAYRKEPAERWTLASCK